MRIRPRLLTRLASPADGRRADGARSEPRGPVWRVCAVDFAFLVGGAQVTSEHERRGSCGAPRAAVRPGRSGCVDNGPAAEPCAVRLNF